MKKMYRIRKTFHEVCGRYAELPKYEDRYEVLKHNRVIKTYKSKSAATKLVNKLSGKWLEDSSETGERRFG